VTTKLTELHPPATDDDDFISQELEYDIPNGDVVTSEALENDYQQNAIRTSTRFSLRKFPSNLYIFH
jgi:hypothetical protein